MTRFAWLPLALLLPVGCGDKDTDDTGDAGPVDADGDGSYADEDCDDNNPDAFPGNTEIWYDGVDGDCDGADDYDQDGDGVRSDQYSGSDCNDEDATISPAATETWYDGIDSDCKGDNDYDQDTDGFDDPSGGGEDCDDTDGSTYPGASDTWYDGVDSDCAGNSDYDADEDGFDSDEHGGDDCDDDNELINTAALEVWYDSVDGDCDGWSDFDQDYDGYDSDDYGGSDCADTDDEAYPSASEQLDGYDTDCDGSGDSYTVEGDYGGQQILGTESGWFGWDLSLGDVDADGASELAVVQYMDGATSVNGDGLVHVFDGAGLGSVGSAASSDYQLLTTGSSGPVESVHFGGGWDGSGNPALLIGAPEATQLSIVGGDPGAVYIFEAATLTAAASQDLSAADTKIWGDGLFLPELGAYVRTMGDLDADGYEDLYLVTGADSGCLASGAFLATSGSYTATDVMECGGTGYGALAAAGDLDGDGYGDIVTGSEGYALVVFGTLGGDGLAGLYNFADVASITPEDSSDQLGSAVTVGDFDDDGMNDLGIGASNAVSGTGRTYIVSGTSVAKGGSYAITDIDEVAWLGVSTFGHSGTALAAGDMDGDGSDDLFVGAEDDNTNGSAAGGGWLVISGRSGSNSLNAADIALLGATSEDMAGSSLGMADVDGNGQADLIIAVPGEDDLTGEEGAVYIGYSGFQW